MSALRAERWIAAIVLTLGTIACNALFADTAQCSTDGDCAGFGSSKICGAEGTCVERGEIPGPASPDASTDAAAAADTATGPSAGPVNAITVAPSTVSVAAGKTHQFSATGRDKLGGTPSPIPTFTWTVSGGGTISAAGLFTAGATAGGPFTVTATSGTITGTASVSVTVAANITIGETNVLATDDSGNGDLLLAQKATLSQPATIKSLSFYVAAVAGSLRLGIYDATGPGGGPGAKKAETNEIAAPAMGFNTAPVVTPVLLPAGDYWLAYAPSSNDLHFPRGNDGTGSIAYFTSAYGPMPATFSTTPTNIADRWSFYATLTP